MKRYALEELRSSRIQYDKKPPRLLFLTIFITLIGIIGIIVLSCFTYKTEVIRSSGILSSDNKTYVMSKTQGEIKEVYKKSGDYVSKGELLFEIDDNQVDSQIIMVESKANLIKEYVDKYENMISFLNSIDLSEEIINPYNDNNELDSIIAEIKNKNTNDEKKELIDSYVNQLKQTLFQYNYEYLGYKGQIDGYNKIKKDYKVYASSDGYLTYATDLKKGMVIGNDNLGTISDSLTKENSIVEVYVDASNKAYLKENMDVEMVVGGLSQTKYGALKGKVISVSNDSIVNENNVLYKIQIKPSNIILKQKNKEVELKNGMVVESRIKYEKTTWMNWCLKRIGIIDR